MKPNDKAYQAAISAIKEDGPYYGGSKIRESMAIYLAEVALPAAYAAQFPPSEDYAGLIKELRKVEPDLPGDRTRWYRNPNGPDAADAIEALLAKLNSKPKPSEDYAGLVERLNMLDGNETQWSAVWEIAEEAADALEALLAERDRLNGVIQSYQILLETQQSMLVDTQTERDALLARLALVDDEALVAIVAKEFIEATTDIPPRTTYTISERSLAGARAAVAAIRPHIEAAERERCAKAVEKVAERINVPHHERPEWEDGYLQGVHDAAAAIRSGK